MSVILSPRSVEAACGIRIARRFIFTFGKLQEASPARLTRAPSSDHVSRQRHGYSCGNTTLFATIFVVSPVPDVSSAHQPTFQVYLVPGLHCDYTCILYQCCAAIFSRLFGALMITSDILTALAATFGRASPTPTCLVSSVHLL